MRYWRLNGTYQVPGQSWRAPFTVMVEASTAVEAIQRAEQEIGYDAMTLNVAHQGTGVLKIKDEIERYVTRYTPKQPST